MSEERTIAVCGLPDSGKTTYLAALWHLLTEREIDTCLRFGSLRNVDASYLNTIANRWRLAKRQDRTPLGFSRTVAMNLLDNMNSPLRLTFPDMSGEVFRRIWEERYCDVGLSDILKVGSGILLFIHADTIRAPEWAIEFRTMFQSLNLPIPATQEIPWHPRLAPTQAQLVDLLQLFRAPPIGARPQRLAIMLSAWDKAVAEGLSPEAFVRDRLPLLHQYLSQGTDGWDYRVYGVSAQGGDYEDAVPNADRLKEAEALRSINKASERILLATSSESSHDLTEPIAWLVR
jgi:hypothetical protein